MDVKTFQRFSELIYRLTGISLKEGKESLLASRINKRMRTLGVDGYDHYLDLVLGDAAGQEVVQLIDAIATNVTSFFREPQHFRFIEEKVGEWLGQGQRRLRFWSAACSTGEEPYTLAMTLLDAARGRDVDMRILATDISTRVLEQCRRGVFTQSRMDGIAGALRERHFTRLGGEQWQAREELRRMIAVARLNLSTPPFPMQGPFDIVMCRNVMIYFDNEVRRALLAEIWRLVRPGGYLIVGHAESLAGSLSQFKSIAPSIYIRS